MFKETILTNLIIIKKKGGTEFDITEEEFDITTDLLGWLDDCNGFNKNKTITTWREKAIDSNTLLIACNGSPVLDTFDVIKNGYEYKELSILDVKDVFIVTYPFFYEQTQMHNNMVALYNKIINKGYDNVSTLCKYDKHCNNNGQDPIEYLFNI